MTLRQRTTGRHRRPAESDARLAELLRDVNAPPTAAELCSPLALDDWRYTRSAHVAALRAAPARRRAAARRHTPVAPVLAAAASVVVVTLTLGGALWRGGTVMAGVAGDPAGVPVSAVLPPSRPAPVRVSVPGSQPASSRPPSVRGTSPASPSLASPSPAAADPGVSTPGGSVAPTGPVGIGSPVTVAGGPEGSLPTGAPPATRSGGDPGATTVGTATSSGVRSSTAGAPSTPAGTGSSGSGSAGPSRGGHGESRGHDRSPTPSPSDGSSATPTGAPVTEPCLGPQGQQLPPRACEALAVAPAASPLPTPSG